MADVFRFPETPPPLPKNEHRATFFTVVGPSREPAPMAFVKEAPEWQGQAIIAAGQSIPRTWDVSSIATEQELRELS
jgi:hypothetical protein